MKTTKEYPATHSMSTAWFIADADGNVGAFEFDDNGPVPVRVPESSMEELIEDDFSYPDEDGFPTFEMTEEQLGGMISLLKPMSDEFDFMDSVVRIDTTKEAEFRQLMGKEDAVCLSRKLGIYIISYFHKEDNASKKKLCQCALEYVKYSIWNTSDWDKEMKEVVYTHYPDSSLPFYLYQQPYWDEIPMKRTIVPLHPFKETQLPPNVRKKLLHIPIKFNDYPDLQVAEFFYSKTSSSFSECEIIDKACYCQLPKSNGEMAYFCSDIFCFTTKTIPPTCRKCRFDCFYLWNIDSKQKRVSCNRLSSEYYSFTPTIAIISDTNVVWYHKMLEWDFFKYFFVLPLIKVSSKSMSYEQTLFSALFNEKIENQFNNCRSMFELQLNYHFPYALIINKQIKTFLAKYYELTDSEITIDQKTYRYFMHENIEADMQEILTLAQQPYRGQTVPYILSKKEMKALKQKEKKQSNE